MKLQHSEGIYGSGVDPVLLLGTMTDNGYKVLGLVEIAQLLGVEKRTPHAWFYRDLMPDPDYPCVNGGRAWDRTAIIKWAATTGRLPPELAEEAYLLVGQNMAVKRGGSRAKALYASDPDGA